MILKIFKSVHFLLNLQVVVTATVTNLCAANMCGVLTYTRQTQSTHG